MRKDEISKSDAEFAAMSKANAIQMLFELQKRLTAAGIDPYQSNTDEF
jgi:hypothetical protein